MSSNGRPEPDCGLQPPLPPRASEFTNRHCREVQEVGSAEGENARRVVENRTKTRLAENDATKSNCSSDDVDSTSEKEERSITSITSPRADDDDSASEKEERSIASITTTNGGQQGTSATATTIAPQVPTDNKIGFHSWALLRATRPKTKFWSAMCGCLASFVLVLFQCIVLVAVIEESSFPGCETHDECREGQYCQGFDDGCIINRLANGICMDCNNTRTTTTTSDDYYSCDWCLSEEHGDEYPDHCDYIVINHRGMRLSTLFVLIFTLLFIVQQMIKDMDQGSKDSDASMNRLNKLVGISRGSQRSLSFYVWFLYYYRAYMLPAGTIMAGVALMISEPLTSQNILLNGVAVTLVCLLDDAAMCLFLSPSTKLRIWQEWHQDLIRRSGFSIAEAKTEFKDWAIHRSYCAVLTVFAFLVTLFTEPAMQNAPRLLAHNGSRGQDTTSCDDITDALVIPIWIALFFSAIDKILRRAEWKVIVRDFICGPILVFCFAVFAISLGDFIHQWVPLSLT